MGLIDLHAACNLHHARSLLWLVSLQVHPNWLEFLAWLGGAHTLCDHTYETGRGSAGRVCDATPSCPLTNRHPACFLCSPGITTPGKWYCTLVWILYWLMKFYLLDLGSLIDPRGEVQRTNQLIIGQKSVTR